MWLLAHRHFDHERLGGPYQTRLAAPRNLAADDQLHGSTIAGRIADLIGYRRLLFYCVGKLPIVVTNTDDK